MYRYLLMVFIVRGLREVSLISERDHVSSIPLLLSIFLVCRWESFSSLFPAISIYIFLYINDDERRNNYFIKVVIIKVSMIVSNVVLSSAVIVVIS